MNGSYCTFATGSGRVHSSASAAVCVASHVGVPVSSSVSPESALSVVLCVDGSPLASPDDASASGPLGPWLDEGPALVSPVAASSDDDAGSPHPATRSKASHGRGERAGTPQGRSRRAAVATRGARARHPFSGTQVWSFRSHSCPFGQSFGASQGVWPSTLSIVWSCERTTSSTQPGSIVTESSVSR